MKGWTHAVTSVFIASLMSMTRARASKVTTTNGDIEGFSVVIDDVTVDIYLGIPFANPPLGQLRFRAPQPVSNWTGVKETKTLPNSCIQTVDGYFDRFEGVEMWNPNTDISEDCLYLNLWVPRLNKTNFATTLIWIYGGSFTFGTSTLDVYDGRYLAAKQGVIVASMQYRMGVLGFLFTDTDDAPGNMGLLDQQLSIKWVYDNIENFGGDSSKITLIGESAGASSISHHMLANSSWPYFNNAILLSGTSLCPWAHDSPDILLEHIKSFANIMNCSNSDKKEIVKCLRNKDALDLEANQWEINYNKNIGTFGPTTDGIFLTDTPSILLNSGNLKSADILLGNTKDEGEYWLIYWYPDIFPNISNPAPLNSSQFLHTMREATGCNEDDLDCEGVLFTYNASNIPSTRGSYRDILDDIVGDITFKCDVRSFASHHASQSHGRTYMYSFEYRHSANPWPSWMGSLHGYEIEPVFGQPFNPMLKYSDLDREVSAKVMDYFTTFANTGNLDSFGNEWPEFTTNSEQHIVFSQDGTTHIREGYRTKECSFWEYLMPKLKQKMAENKTTSGAIFHSLSTIIVCVIVIISAIIIR
ncbi:cholinesterase 1-like isoform X2 [Ruditapes philippinarum]|nr:cholinesterase 1-like isoform X2 [Ruditapes philippinarum]XP_060569609.1 cholinesterase 1-like isoform X2 [Ruditapes philippinarum]XP_060569616.1 cholinesterase 1-like isoform X2 [Ruditapes philippinarum]XP_060569624.1 cholinesterase 1-like isoform X2 [Ruditapes philippinarum]XP_060569629.1 cholinesterase 1-like isoform X2 [Ruditapes philippinarum]